jgi:hypothetical protein
LPTLHEALAKGYDGLGNTSMAAQHRKLAGSGSPDPTRAGQPEVEKQPQPAEEDKTP